MPIRNEPPMSNTLVKFTRARVNAYGCCVCLGFPDPWRVIERSGRILKSCSFLEACTTTSRDFMKKEGLLSHGFILTGDVTRIWLTHHTLVFIGDVCTLTPDDCTLHAQVLCSSHVSARIAHLSLELHLQTPCTVRRTCVSPTSPLLSMACCSCVRYDLSLAGCP